MYRVLFIYYISENICILKKLHLFLIIIYIIVSDIIRNMHASSMYVVYKSSKSVHNILCYNLL